MSTRITAAAALAMALGLPMASAAVQAQNLPTPPAANAQAQDPHHPAGQDAGAAPATGSPATGSPAAGGTHGAPASGSTPASPPAQMGMMMGDMHQMMGMMRQMMGMMRGQMMGGGMPMMGMTGGQAQVTSGMGSNMGQGTGTPQGASAPMGMFRHTEGILAFYKAELRITDAQTAPWNTFADAVRTHVKSLREAMQRAATQRPTATATEQLDQRVALLSAQLDATKAVAAAGKALYAALTPEQRKLADAFMGDHLRGMRGMMP